MELPRNEFKRATQRGRIRDYYKCIEDELRLLAQAADGLAAKFRA